MKKYILFLLFFTLKFHAQSNYQVDYNLKISDISENAIKDKYLKIAIKGSDLVHFTLIFNKDISLFSDQTKTQSREATLAKAWADYTEPIYTDLKSNKIFFYNKQTPVTQGKTYIINEDILLDWQLTNQTKSIEGFTCYKATGTYKQGGRYKNITAWYAPQLPFSFGPMGYAGLPGLILELHMDNVMLGATKITKLHTLNKIEIPSQGILISEDQYSKLINSKSKR